MKYKHHLSKKTHQESNNHSTSLHKAIKTDSGAIIESEDEIE
jgi:hypothetical protein